MTKHIFEVRFMFLNPCFYMVIEEERRKSLIFVALRLNCTYKNNQITLNTQNTYRIENCKIGPFTLTDRPSSSSLVKFHDSMFNPYI